MITAVIIGTLICGGFPFLFLPVFRRMEAERVRQSTLAVDGNATPVTTAQPREVVKEHSLAERTL